MLTNAQLKALARERRAARKARRAAPPLNLSRQNRRDLERLVRDQFFEGARHEVVVHFEGRSAQASLGFRTDEGGGRRYVAAGAADDASNGRAYRLSVRVDERDCDGRSSRAYESVVVPRRKRERWYWGTGAEGSPRGRFESRPPWRAVEAGESEQRDYAAEAAGY